MYPYEVQTMIRLQNLFYNDGLPEISRIVYGGDARLFHNRSNFIQSLDENSKSEINDQDSYLIASYNENGVVTYINPISGEKNEKIEKTLFGL